MEFTQPLGVGLGLVVRINNQYSHPVCTGRRTDDFATINDMQDQKRSFGRVEFTQPLGVGLGLVVRINTQYSHPVCTGRRTDDFATINDMQEISRYYWLLTWER